jgi:hypothetical protein
MAEEKPFFAASEQVKTPEGAADEMSLEEEVQAMVDKEVEKKKTSVQTENVGWRRLCSVDENFGRR